MRAHALARDEGGATAIEMALLAPVFLMLLVGIIHGGLLVFTHASLHYAVQKRVRCISITDLARCPEAESYYFAPGAPDFTDTWPGGTQRCVAVTGTVRYDFDLVFFRRDIALSSTACFPHILGAPST